MLARRVTLIAGACALALAAAGCGGPVTKLAPGDDLQAALLAVEFGGVIELAAGRYELTQGLSLDVDGVTVRGAGSDKTILSFKNQTGAAEGLMVTSDGVTLTGFAVEDAKGDAIKSKGADRIIYRDLVVEWTGGPKTENGAYGVYPVESQHVLVERVTVRGASDAGIYVGQSDNIIVRNNTVERNVAGIEIENSTNAEVTDNVARHNTAGILIFDLPDLPKVGGGNVLVRNNTSVDNDQPNFGRPGSVVASVPKGVGIIVMANQNVVVEGNELSGNGTTHILISAYRFPGLTDVRYIAVPRDITVRGNRFGPGGNAPDGELAALAPALGGTLPPVIWDGSTQWAVGGEIRSEVVRLFLEGLSPGQFLSLGLAQAGSAATLARPSPQPPVNTGAPPAPLAPIALPQSAS